MTAPDTSVQSLAPLPAPSKPQSIITSGNGSRRYWDTYFDQYRNQRRFPQGRPWTGQREKHASNEGAPGVRGHLNDGFVGSDLSPGEHVTDETGAVDRRATFETVWNAPYLPEVRFFDFNDQQKKIRIRNDKLKATLVRAENEYYMAAAKVSLQVSGVSIVFGVQPSYQVTSIVGFPPLSPKLADMLAVGDPWLLGYADEVNVEAARLLGMNERGETIYGGTLFLPAPAPIVTPAQVIAAATPVDLEKLIAEATAKAVNAALAAERAKKPKGGNTANMRAAKERKRVERGGMGGIGTAQNTATASATPVLQEVPA